MAEIAINTLIIALIGMVVAAVVIFMAVGQSNSFTDFLGEQSDSAKCDLKYSQWEGSLDCSDNNPENGYAMIGTSEAETLAEELQSQCSQYSPSETRAREVCGW